MSSRIDVRLGDGTVIHGNFAVADSIRSSFNKATASEAPDDVKDLLRDLGKSVASMTERLPNEKAEEVARDLDALTSEATSSAPRRRWWELSVESIRQVATTIEDAAEVGKPVVDVLTRLAAALAGIPT